MRTFRNGGPSFDFDVTGVVTWKGSEANLSSGSWGTGAVGVAGFAIGEDDVDE